MPLCCLLSCEKKDFSICLLLAEKIDGEIGQHNNKLYQKVIGSENKFSQTCKNLWGAPINYRAPNRWK